MVARSRMPLPLCTRRVALEQDAKWVVEYQVGNTSIVLDETDPKHAVYIYGCKDTVVQVSCAGRLRLIRCQATRRLTTCLRGGQVLQATVWLAARQ